MKNKSLKENSQAGFAPLLIIAIVALLAVGGGAYVVTKNKQAQNTELESNLDAGADVNANLGVNTKAKGTFRSLIGLGQNTMCTFTSMNEGVTSSGTVYISASGNMRGDFTSQMSSGTQSSSMILKDGYSYVWSGSQGAKMNVASSTNASAGAQAEQSVDLDSQVDYDCQAWSMDESKFAVPSSVEFLDIEAMMKGSAVPGGVNLEGMMKGKAY